MMHMEKKEDKWRKPRSVKGHVGEDTYDLAMSSVESFFITKTKTIYRRKK
ncbi:hypothetical protein T06_6999 [Trichinella sp. T6]|nr:hypothetical protein T06_6999 [Trichinella sp. T6]